MKKLAAILLVPAILMTLLAGCAGSSEPSTPTDDASQQSGQVESETPQPSPEQQAQPSPETAPETEPDEPPAEPEPEMSIKEKIAGRPTQELPLTEEPTTLTYWTGSLHRDATISSWAECDAYTELERLTGVHIDFIEVAPPVMQEQYNLMIISEQYPDILTECLGYSTSGIDGLIDDEIVVDITDLINEYCVSYAALMKADDSLRRDTYSDTGRAAGLAGYSINSITRSGFIIRKDWVEKLGIAYPVTIDDYYNTMKLFQTQGLCEHPFPMVYSGILEASAILATSGVYNASTGGFYYDENDEMQCMYLQPEFKEYLELLNKWYVEGLIYPDLQQSSMYNTEDIASGRFGIFDNQGEFFPTFEDAGKVNDPDFEVIGISEPLAYEGQIIEYKVVDTYTPSMFVSTGCKDVPLALKWLDFRFSEQGSLLCNYGIEGRGLEYDAQGNPQYSDLIVNNSDGLSLTLSLIIYTLNTNVYVKDFQAVYDIYTPNQQASADIWGSTRVPGKSSYMAGYQLSTEESTEFANLYGDIGTYIEENVAKFIVGERPLSEYDSFTAQLKEMNIARIGEIYKAAEERYYRR